MINVAICDDEKMDIDTVYGFLKAYEKENQPLFNIHTYQHSKLFFEDMKKGFDVVFLDIRMGDANGVEVARKIRETNEKMLIIFITGVEDQWKAGFQVGAFQYLVKPIDRKEFFKEITRLLVSIRKKDAGITLKIGRQTLRIKNSDISYFEIRGRNVVVHTKGEEYETSETMNAWEERMMPYGFASPHKSYLVNMGYILKLTDDMVTLKGNIEIPMAQRKRGGFKKMFTKFVGDN